MRRSIPIYYAQKMITLGLSLFQKEQIIDNKIKIQVGILVLDNTMILLVTDQEFRLGSINLPTVQQTNSSRPKLNVVTLFGGSSQNTLISRMIGNYLAKKINRPVLSIIHVKAQDPKVVKKITTLIDDLILKNNLN